jgi:hypothetical protein
VYDGHASSPPSDAKLMIRPLPQEARCRLRAQVLRFQIDVQNRVPLLFGQFLEFCGEKHSNVVHQNVQPAEVGFNGREQCANVGTL